MLGLIIVIAISLAITILSMVMQNPSESIDQESEDLKENNLKQK